MTLSAGGKHEDNQAVCATEGDLAARGGGALNGAERTPQRNHCPPCWDSSIQRLPDAQMSTLEGKWKSLCPGTAANMLCDLSKVISRPWLSLRFPVCELKALGLMFSNCELWPIQQVCNRIGGM